MTEVTSFNYARNSDALVPATAGARMVRLVCSETDPPAAEIITAQRRAHSAVTEASVARVSDRGQDTEPRRYSMGDVLRMLNRPAREAFDAERARLNHELKSRYEEGEITALAYFRGLARMTQHQVADQSGVAQPYISKIERGRALLSKKKAIQLAAALGVSPAQLLEIDHGAE